MARRLFTKITLITLCFLLFFALFVPAALGQEDNSTTELTELPAPGITPDSFWYFAEILKERVMLIFTFNKAAKVEKYLALAQERIAESKAMLERDKNREAITAIDEYVSLIKRAEYTSRVAQSDDLEKIKANSLDRLQQQGNHFRNFAQLTDDQIVTPKISEARRWIGQLRSSFR